MKKIFAFIMAVLVLSFSCMACADETSMGNEVENYFRSKPGNEEPEEDHCSPFCSCGCCAASSVTHLIVLSTPPSLVPAKVDTNFLPAQTLEPAFPFWQPPRSS